MLIETRALDSINNFLLYHLNIIIMVPNLFCYALFEDLLKSRAPD